MDPCYLELQEFIEEFSNAVSIDAKCELIISGFNWHLLSDLTDRDLDCSRVKLFRNDLGKDTIILLSTWIQSLAQTFSGDMIPTFLLPIVNDLVELFLLCYDESFKNIDDRLLSGILGLLSKSGIIRSDIIRLCLLKNNTMATRKEFTEYFHAVIEKEEKGSRDLHMTLLEILGSSYFLVSVNDIDFILNTFELFCKNSDLLLQSRDYLPFIDTFRTLCLILQHKIPNACAEIKKSSLIWMKKNSILILNYIPIECLLLLLYRKGTTMYSTNDVELQLDLVKQIREYMCGTGFELFKSATLYGVFGDLILEENSVLIRQYALEMLESLLDSICTKCHDEIYTETKVKFIHKSLDMIVSVLIHDPINDPIRHTAFRIIARLDLFMKHRLPLTDIYSKVIYLFSVLAKDPALSIRIHVYRLCCVFIALCYDIPSLDVDQLTKELYQICADRFSWFVGRECWGDKWPCNCQSPKIPVMIPLNDNASGFDMCEYKELLILWKTLSLYGSLSFLTNRYGQIIRDIGNDCPPIPSSFSMLFVLNMSIRIYDSNPNHVPKDLYGLIYRTYLLWDIAWSDIAIANSPTNLFRDIGYVSMHS
jgi:hypothetical protein